MARLFVLRFAALVLAGACSTAPPPPPAAQTGPATMGCAEVSQRLNAAIDSAAQGCSPQVPCVVFESCHPVTSDSVAGLRELRNRILNACRGQPEGSSLLSCGPQAVCVSGRCQWPSSPPAAAPARSRRTPLPGD